MNGRPYVFSSQHRLDYDYVDIVDRFNRNRVTADVLATQQPTPLSSAWNGLLGYIGRAPSGVGSKGSFVRGVEDGTVTPVQVPASEEIQRMPVEDNTVIEPVEFTQLPVIDPPEGVFCIYGRPGSGKTVFTSALVDLMLIANQGLFQHVFIFVPGDRPEWKAIERRHSNVTILRKARETNIAAIVKNQKSLYEKGKPNKIMMIFDDQMGQGQGIHNGPLGDLIDRIAASNRQPELNIVFFVLAQHVTFIPPSMRLTARMMAYTQPTDDSLDTIMGCQGIQLDKEMVKAYAQSNQFVVLDCWTSKVYATKSYHLN